MSEAHAEVHSSASHTDPVYAELKATDEFDELRRKYAAFVFPATATFLLWYLLYVFMSNWAHGFMSHRLVGHINVALVFGLLQFVSTFAIAWGYSRYMNRQVDPIARDLETRFRAAKGGDR